MLKRTRHVLSMIRAGRRSHVMKLLGDGLGEHDKMRCNEYLSLMYLMLLAGSQDDEIDVGLEALSPAFVDQIEALNAASQQTARDSNSIATALESLFDAYRQAVDQDEQARLGDDDDREDHVAKFIERYLVRFEDLDAMEPVSAGRLLAALRTVARQFSLEFEYRKPAQLARRISNDLQVLEEAGFAVERDYNTHAKTFYNRIRRVRGSE